MLGREMLGGLASLVFAVVIPAWTHLHAESQLPLKSVALIVEPNAQTQFFERLKAFGDENAFAVRIAPTRPDRRFVLIQMWRADIKIFGLNPAEVTRFKVRFYANDAHPPNAQVIDALAERLVAKVGGTAIVENHADGQ